MKPSPALRHDLVAAVPSLRAFGISLSGDADRADDLVQETLVKAWSNLDSFQEGTNLRAWLFTILRNQFYSEMRKKKREVEDADGSLQASLSVPAAQQGHMDMVDFRRALLQLPDDQREALILVGASGFAYEEAAEICGVAVGTIKSRVSRARLKLAEILKLGKDANFGTDTAVEMVATVVGHR
ncbi:MAG: sigma-70 family RNA polymerase sigma factor [Parvibaculaceae bacterium]